MGLGAGGLLGVGGLLALILQHANACSPLLPQRSSFRGDLWTPVPPQVSLTGVSFDYLGLNSWSHLRVVVEGLLAVFWRRAALRWPPLS